MSRSNPCTSASWSSAEVIDVTPTPVAAAKPVKSKSFAALAQVKPVSLGEEMAPGERIRYFSLSFSPACHARPTLSSSLILRRA
jgi:hypothetical protein